MIEWSTYVGGATGGSMGSDSMRDVTVDLSGNVIVVGEATATDFPLVNPLQPANAGAFDAVVMKLDSTGTAVIWSTYLGGNLADRAYGVVTGSDRSVYVVGQTLSASFPTLNAAQPAMSGTQDAFVAKIASNGTLAWSTFLGGTGNVDGGRAIAIDSADNIYVAGITTLNFPVTGGVYDPTPGLGNDGFVASYTSAGVLRWATLLGFNAAENALGLAFSPTNGLIVAGDTASTDFPYTLGNGISGIDSFVLRLTTDGTTLVWSRLIGGTGTEHSNGVSARGTRIALGGDTASASGLATAGAFDTTIGGAQDGFVATLNSAGGVDWISYFGGAGTDALSDLVIDTNLNVYAVGDTASTDFTHVTPFDNTPTGNEGLAVLFDATGASTLWSSYLGGGVADLARGCALTATNAVVIAGQTNSTDFPEPAAPGFDKLEGGVLDGFAVRVSSVVPTAVRVDGPRAFRVGKQVEIEWILLDARGVASMRVLRESVDGADEEIGVALPGQDGGSGSFVVRDDAPAPASRWRLEVLLDDGTIETYGPALLEEQPSPPSCAAARDGGAGVTVALVVLAMLIVRSRKADGAAASRELGDRPRTPTREVDQRASSRRRSSARKS